MAKVSKIKTQKKRRNRYSIFVDGKFEVGISERDLVETGIYNGKEITKKELEKIKKKSIESKVLNKALKFLSIRPRSIKELQRKLEEKNYDSKLIKKTIDFLKKEKLLDDKKFTRDWISFRQKFHPLGKKKLFLELRKKDIPEDIIEKEISKISFKKEIEEAKELAQKRIKLYKDLDKYKKREKIVSFLKRRGYSWNIIKEIIEKIPL